MLSGPVEFIDSTAGTFTSLGQVVYASQQTLAKMQNGDFVAVLGTVIGPGHLYADQVARYSKSYIPGASKVLVTGLPTSIDKFTGVATIGGIKVDYTSALVTGVHPGSGEIAFSGIQPSSQGIIVSSQFGQLN